MTKETIPGRNNYNISCLHNITGNEKIVVVASHGFGSSKESPTVLNLMKALPAHGIGVLAYDFPGHGESPVGGEMLRIENCLDDLAVAETYGRKLAPQAEIVYFSSSFGAYINLIYLAKRPHLGQRAFLRAAAVNMPEIFKGRETSEFARQLETQGFFTIDMDYGRSLKVTQEFCQDLETHDVFALSTPGMNDIAMIHGDADETASVEDARRFAAQFHATLTIVKDGSHRLMESDQMKLIMETAIQFFTNP